MFKFILAILGAVVEVERELTVERIREGMDKAKINGTKTGCPVGHPPRQIPSSFKKYYPIWKDGVITATDFARLIGVSRPILYQYIHEHKTGYLPICNLKGVEKY